MSSYYCCSKDGNDCGLKNNCSRYLQSDTEQSTTLFKYACVDENMYMLFIKSKEVDDDGTKKESNEESN